MPLLRELMAMVNKIGSKVEPSSSDTKIHNHVVSSLYLKATIIIKYSSPASVMQLLLNIFRKITALQYEALKLTTNKGTQYEK